MNQPLQEALQASQRGGWRVLRSIWRTIDQQWFIAAIEGLDRAARVHEYNNVPCGDVVYVHLFERAVAYRDEFIAKWGVDELEVRAHLAPGLEHLRRLATPQTS